VKNLDGTTSTIQSPGYIRVRFSVLETLRGEPQKEITVLTNGQSSACGFAFADASEYVVFTSTNDETNELWTSKCSLTHKLESDRDDLDLSWMRGLATAAPGATLYGSVRLPPGLAGPAAPARISVRGPQALEAASDKTGHYTFNGLSPGEYTVSAVMPSGLTTVAPRTVTVANKGCAQVDWPAYYDSHIRGRVTDTSGHALGEMFMVLQRRDSGFATGFADVGFAETDSDGRYDFASIPPGDYLVVANNLGPSADRPYPRLYYPNTESDAHAITVHLAPSDTIENINLTFPNAWKPVVVQARVIEPDGSPPTGAEIEAHDVNYKWSGEPAMTTAGADGHAALTVYEGRSYYLTATISGGTQQRCAGPLKFTATDGLTLPTIVIDHNWGNCLAQLNTDFEPPR
jgi:Carboxypeptidase regulatory-like domain